MVPAPRGLDGLWDGVRGVVGRAAGAGVPWLATRSARAACEGRWVAVTRQGGSLRACRWTPMVLRTRTCSSGVGARCEKNGREGRNERGERRPMPRLSGSRSKNKPAEYEYYTIIRVFRDIIPGLVKNRRAVSYLEERRKDFY